MHESIPIKYQILKTKISASSTCQGLAYHELRITEVASKVRPGSRKIPVFYNSLATTSTEQHTWCHASSVFLFLFLALPEIFAVLIKCSSGDETALASCRYTRMGLLLAFGHCHFRGLVG